LLKNDLDHTRYLGGNNKINGFRGGEKSERKRGFDSENSGRSVKAKRW